MAIRKYAGSSTTPKSERLEARVTPQQKGILQRAAELQGVSLTDFLVTSAHEAAKEIIRENNVITLTAQDSIAFTNALFEQHEPNAVLRAAFARYAEEPLG